jgi:hypothetical protein
MLELFQFSENDMTTDTTSITTPIARILRGSLKRPSKLDLKISLNDEQQHQQATSQSDKNNNCMSIVHGCGKSSSSILKDSTNRSQQSEQHQQTTNNKPANSRNLKKKKRRFASDLVTNRFSDVYTLTNEVLGEGSYGKVCTCRNIYTDKEYAVKIIDKYLHPNRERVFKEIEIFLHCRDCENILQIIEFFEEDERFYVVFEKMLGGPLLDHIEKRGHLSEHEASLIVRDIANSLNFLHSKGN